MSGLDSIVEEIHSQARAEADEIIKKAEEYCNSFMEQAKKDVSIEAEKLEKKALADRKLYEEKTKSGAEFRQRNSMLKVKQECIHNVIMKAQSTIQNLDDESYFDLLEKLFETNVSTGNGIIFFSGKDLARMPESFKKNIQLIAKNKGGNIEISAESRDIEDGFILVYGEIEENCTIKALFMANADKLKDIANKTLFGALN